MLNDIYTITNWLTIGITFVFCLFFCILSVPKTENLRNYCMARYMMACAYFSLGLINIVELNVQKDTMDIQSTKMICLLVCLLQSFLFSYANITLINTYFATKQKILLESIPIVLFCILIPVVLSINSSPIYADILFYTFIAYYISVLIRYTILFRKNHRDYICKMDNFFAGEELKRFRWIHLSFYAALTIGVMALFITLFFSIITGTIFSLFIVGFYSYYGIQFINYAFLFQQHIEYAIIDKEKIEKNNKEDCIVIRNQSLLEANIKNWIAGKRYLEEGINIKNVALELNTNRTYLSDYVNTNLQKTFREWIGELRIEEACNLLLKNPDLSISEISEMVGFSDNSNFGKLFVKYTGMTPKEWKISKMS